MAYTAINKSVSFFDTKLYTGNGGNQTITGLNFQPDMVWTKGRTDAASTGNDNHSLTDVVRTAGSYGRPMIHPNLTAAEYDPSSGNEQVKTFTSDGFTLGGNENANYNGTSYVAWNWKAGNAAGSSNSNGSITSTVSVNTTAGFSIVKYTGTGSNATVGHGLGAVPKMIIIKETDATTNWIVYHNAIGNGGSLQLNTNIATDTDSTFWNSTTPTSTVFTLGSNGNSNGSSDNYIAYCFAEVPGFSKFGTYTGNGNSDGAFVYTGFRPSWMMIKESSNAGNEWYISDSTRSPINAGTASAKVLAASGSGAEESGQSYNQFDIVSNGYKVRGDDTRSNGSGRTYVYMAFGQTIVSSNNIPCNAR